MPHDKGPGKTGAPIFQDNQKQKLDAVRDIMALLNLSASYAVGEALTEAVLEQSADKVLAMRKTFKNLPAALSRRFWFEKVQEMQGIVGGEPSAGKVGVHTDSARIPEEENN